MKQDEYEKQQKISIEILSDYKPLHVANYMIFGYHQIQKCLNESMSSFKNKTYNDQFIKKEFKFRIIGDFKVDE